MNEHTESLCVCVHCEWLFVFVVPDDAVLETDSSCVESDVSQIEWGSGK